MHININGLRTKRQILTEYLADERVDIVSLNETRLTDQIVNMSVPGFDFERRDRVADHAGGGVGLLVRKGVWYKPINTDDFERAEVVAIETRINKRITAVVSIYNPPYGAIDSEVIKYFTDRYTHCIILGDFNSKHLFFGCKRTDYAGEVLFDIAEDCNLHLVNDTGEATYQRWSGIVNQHQYSEVLDFIFVTRPILAMVQKCEVKGDLTSDHLPVHLELDRGRGRLDNCPPVYRRSLKNMNWQNFEQDVIDNLQNDPSLGTPDEIDNSCDSVSAAINAAVDKNCTTVKIRPFVWRCSEKTLSLIRLKRKFRRKTQVYPDNPGYRYAYSILKNRVQKLVKEEKRQSYMQYCETLNEERGKGFWQAFHRVTGSGNRKHSSGKTLVYNNATAETEPEKADVFAQSLAKSHSTHEGPIFCNFTRRIVGACMVRKAHMFKPLSQVANESGDDHSMLENISAQEIWSVISKCKKNSSPGADCISYNILNKCPLGLHETLAQIFNRCLEIGYFPKPWKSALGVMLPKPGKDHSNPASYRPISLLSCIGKTFERVLTNRVTNDLDSKGFFNRWQRAYRKKCEGVEHIHRLVSEGRAAISKKWCTGAIFLDVEKAFDSVWHDGLRYKLSNIGLPVKMVRILSSFIRDRNISVRQGQTISNPVELKAGTPQGSVLSPLLFLIYVNDLAVDPRDQVHVSQFADDLGFWTSAKSIQYVQARLQRALTKLEDWCSMWRIKINAGKSQVILFNRRIKPTPFQLSLFGVRLDPQPQAKLLGVTLDTRLTLKAHIDSICDRATKRIRLLYKIRGTGWGADSACIMLIYKMYIRPLFEYGAVAIADCSATALARYQRLQNWALRVAFRQPRYCRIQVLHDLAKIETVSERLESLQESCLERISRSELYQEHLRLLALWNA